MKQLKVIVGLLILLFFILLFFTTTSCDDIGCGGSGVGQYATDNGQYFP